MIYNTDTDIQYKKFWEEMVTTVTRNLRKHDFGQDVITLQKALVKRSYPCPVNGIFCKLTERYLKNFQKWEPGVLTQTGVADYQTRKALDLL